MNTETLTSYLLNDEAQATPAQIEQVQLLLGGGRPPEHLVTATLAAMDEEIDNYHRVPSIVPLRPKKSSHRFWAGGVVALAAAMLLQLNIDDEPAEQSVQMDNMTPKGVEATAPEVSLELAVLSNGDGVERFSSEQTYGSGDAVFFRAGASSSANVALFHIESGEITTLLETTLEQGETDLSVDNTPARWLFESGDEDAVFLLVSLPDDTSIEGVTQTINDVLLNGGGDLCESLRMIGCQCDHRAVMVSTE